MAFLFSACWLKRFSSLRRVPLKDSEVQQSFTAISDGVNNDKEDQQETVVDRNLTFIALQLGRDSSEQYLFMVEYMRQAGLVWSPVIIGLYAYGVFLVIELVYFLYNYYNLFSVVSIANSISSLVVQFIMYFVFPTWSLAHANSFLNPVISLFNNANCDDFEIIGNN